MQYIDSLWPVMADVDADSCDGSCKTFSNEIEESVLPGAGSGTSDYRNVKHKEECKWFLDLKTRHATGMKNDRHTEAIRAVLYCLGLHVFKKKNQTYRLKIC